MAQNDLQLIRAFVAVFETGSVSDAAKRMQMTQPSVSYALNRLRDVCHRPLFTRTKSGMSPTALAAELYPGWKEALTAVDAAFANILTFDPSTSRRTFKIAMTDLGEIAFLPAIVRALAEQAPSVGLEVRTVRIDSVADWLLKGLIDAAICPAFAEQHKVESTRIFQEHYRCIYRVGHPRLGRSLTLEAYQREAHIALAESVGHQLVENSHRAQGVAPRIVLRLPGPGVLESIVAMTDCLAVVPSRIAAVFEQLHRVQSADLPFDVPSFDVRVHWWNYRDQTPEALWFRNILIEALVSPQDT